MTKFTEKDWERLERYIRNGLSDPETKEVEALINNEELWQKAYQSLKTAEHVGRNEFRTHMKLEFNRIDQEKRRSTRRLFIWVGAAASILLVVVFTLIGIQRDTGQDLLASYEKLPNVAFPIEKSSSASDLRTQAFQSYELGNYQQALSAYAAIQDAQPVDLLYQGLTLYELGEVAESAEVLERVVELQDARWSPVADWYLVFVEESRGEKDAAWNRIERISKSQGHQYRDNALKLINER